METKTIELTISGMHCNACVTSIRESLLHCDGTQSAEVSIGAARITFDRSRCSVGELIAAVHSAGDFSIAGFRTV